MGPGKAVALRSKPGRADCADAERGVRVPLWSSFCNSSSDKPVGLRSEFQTFSDMCVLSTPSERLARLLTRPFKLAFQSPSSKHSCAFLRDSAQNVDASPVRCVSVWSSPGQPLCPPTTRFLVFVAPPHRLRAEAQPGCRRRRQHGTCSAYGTFAVMAFC